MSQITDQAGECAASAIEHCRTLLSYGPVLTPEVLYETRKALDIAGAILQSLEPQLKAECSKTPSPTTKPESPAQADLCGRQ